MTNTFTQSKTVSNALSLFIGGLTSEMTHSSVLSCIQQAVSVTDLRLIMDHKTGRSRGYGFFTVPTQLCAKMALQASPLSLGTHQLIIKPAFDPSADEQQSSTRVFLKSKPALTSEHAITQAVKSLGTPSLIHLYRDFNGLPKAYGFIEFESEAVIGKALTLKKIYYKEKHEISFYPTKLLVRKALKVSKRKANRKARMAALRESKKNAYKQQKNDKNDKNDQNGNRTVSHKHKSDSQAPEAESPARAQAATMKNLSAKYQSPEALLNQSFAGSTKGQGKSSSSAFPALVESI